MCTSDRLVLGIADAPDEQGHQLGAQNEPVEGQRPEALLHAPLLTGRLVWTQVGVWDVSAGQPQHITAGACGVGHY